ncbi:25_t:CDS:2, partial [Cetraspora pellucida]
MIYNSEQRHQLFLELFDTDPSLTNALNSEQHHRLYFVLIAIDPSLTEPLLDARSAVRGMINEQFPKGSVMNPITFNKYENYKEAQKKAKKDVQWHKFLKLDKKQYLNFRSIKKKKKVTEARTNEYTLPLKKKNVKPPIRRRNCNTNNNVNNGSTLDQNNIDNTDNAQDLDDNISIVASGQDSTNESDNSDVKNISSQDESLAFAKNRFKRGIRPPKNISSQDDSSTLVKNSDSDEDQSSLISPDNASSSLKKNLHSSVQKHDNIKSTEHNAQNSDASDDI